MAERKRKHPARFVCFECNRSFTRRLNLLEHQNSSHQRGSRHFGCSTCRKRFLRPSDRNRHERLQHNDNYSFVCGKLPEHNDGGCGKGFKRRDALKEHRSSRNCLMSRELENVAEQKVVAEQETLIRDILSAVPNSLPYGMVVVEQESTRLIPTDNEDLSSSRANIGNSSALTPPLLRLSNITSSGPTTSNELPEHDHIILGYDVGKLNPLVIVGGNGIFYPNYTLSVRIRVPLDKAGYFADKVPIIIPRAFTPFPSRLQENYEDLMYFHHFINHTARLMVAYDDETNPFRFTLPQMALQDDVLLTLLLVYSACHRARLLGEIKPIQRVFDRMSDLPLGLLNLNSNLNKSPISATTIARRLMVTSIGIVDPTYFGAEFHWRWYLGATRSMIQSEACTDTFSQQHEAYPFLLTWFGYLDVVSGLSGPWRDEPLLLSTPPDQFDEFNNLLGFTPRCANILAQIASLIKVSRSLSDISTSTAMGQPKMEYFSLLADIAFSLIVTNTMDEQEFSPKLAMNEAFHLAGEIHLRMRATGYEITDSKQPELIVKRIIMLSNRVKSGNGDARLLFPMFTAGCYSKSLPDQEFILRWLTIRENYGLVQARQAIYILKNVWSTGKTWETFVQDESFF